MSGRAKGGKRKTRKEKPLSDENCAFWTQQLLNNPRLVEIIDATIRQAKPDTTHKQARHLIQTAYQTDQPDGCTYDSQVWNAAIKSRYEAFNKEILVWDVSSKQITPGVQVPAAPAVPPVPPVPSKAQKAHKAHKAHKPPKKNEIKEGTLPVYAVTDKPGILAEFRKSGVVLINGAFDATTCGELVLEQWREIMLKQPYTDEHKLKVESEDGRPLDVSQDSEEFLAQVTKAPIPPTQLRKLKNGWPLHRGFGACCDPAAFHLAGVWTRVRQNPGLYKIAAELMGEEELWVGINRSIQKLPTEGEDEFLHWDINPFATKGAAARAKSFNPSGLAGKVCYTDSRWVGVLGSHTDEFHQKFVEQYGHLYPHVKSNATKFGLDPSKPDPAELWKRQRKYAVPAGCVIFWDHRILHGQTKTPADAPIEYGCYLGYSKAGSRAEYAQTCGVDEREDRLDSFARGCAPQLWPSLDKIHYYPHRFQNFPKILQGYIDKMPPGHPSIQTRRSQKGQIMPHLVPIVNHEYVPPWLSDLGRRLLGIEPWSQQKSDGAKPTSKKPKRSNSITAGTCNNHSLLASDSDSEDDLPNPKRPKPIRAGTCNKHSPLDFDSESDDGF